MSINFVFKPFFILNIFVASIFKFLLWIIRELPILGKYLNDNFVSKEFSKIIWGFIWLSSKQNKQNIVLWSYLEWMTNIPNIYYKFGSIIKVNLCFTNQNRNKYFATTGNIKLKSFIKRMKTVVNNYKVTKTFSEEHSKLIRISKRKFSTKVVIRLKLWLLICSKIQPILFYMLKKWIIDF